ncbi:hypothetical protein K3495_g14327 [Podosphaera aphanis]|nr:hypothetical protein K3495_g14327 [Podosphaera aphanis]
MHDSEKSNTLIPSGDQLFFEEEELQELWNIGVMKDIVMMKELYNTMWNDIPQFASNLQLKVARAECELDVRGALLFRKRLWIPD